MVYNKARFTPQFSLAYIYNLLNKIDNSIGFADDIIVFYSDYKIKKIKTRTLK